MCGYLYNCKSFHTLSMYRFVCIPQYTPAVCVDTCTILKTRSRRYPKPWCVSWQTNGSSTLPKQSQTGPRSTARRLPTPRGGSSYKLCLNGNPKSPLMDPTRMSPNEVSSVICNTEFRVRVPKCHWSSDKEATSNFLTGYNLGIRDQGLGFRG